MSRALSSLKALAPALQDLLDRCGAVGEVRAGSKHFKLYVDGRMLQVLPRGRPRSARTGHGPGRADMNALSSVRRALASMGYVERRKSEE